MWVKICGMTTGEAVEAALAAQVDAIGFVFAASSRRVSATAASALAAPVRGRIHCIAVTQHPSQQLVDELLEEFHPDALQIDMEDLSGLRLPQSLALLPVLRAGRAPPERIPPRLLFEGPVSGVGQSCDWTAARNLARRAELILAGGLTQSTVAAAISEVRPFGVDVSSGVEDRPGIKSPEKIMGFAAAARAAFRALRGPRAPDEEPSS